MFYISLLLDYSEMNQWREQFHPPTSGLVCHPLPLPVVGILSFLEAFDGGLTKVVVARLLDNDTNLGGMQDPAAEDVWLGERRTAEPYTSELGGRTLEVSDIRREEGTDYVRTSLLVEKSRQSWSPFPTFRRPAFSTAVIALATKPTESPHSCYYCYPITRLPAPRSLLPFILLVLLPSYRLAGSLVLHRLRLEPFAQALLLNSTRHPTDEPTYGFSNKQANQSAITAPPSRQLRVDFINIETPFIQSSGSTGYPTICLLT
ncbi:hypothetical protein BC938DRAFT_478307 [Jimgerdemannia flammicorona]|uniref:Uncharacterized protein n=1 Tax=Jimgerdemannia flammicorona TaxID=994334 RepID=A0A433QN29_9FUNG|nr:hypothetical protein BC938DRAFT_478307 [Jimgerdemannia flammicorona]